MNNHSIGILTFHSADNVGACLQAYALQKTLLEHCNNVDIINYYCNEVESTKKSHKGGIKRILENTYYMLKRKGFNAFRRKYLKLSTKIYYKDTISETNDIYDTFITGSDQIWNLSCSGNDYTYFLDFVSNNNRKYSYAASIGNYVFSDNDKVQVAKKLNEFSAISVREASARKELESFFNDKAISVLPDPVFLLTKEMWCRLLKRPRIDKKYVFVYLIQEDVNVLRAARKYAEENNCVIINNKKSIDFILNNSPIAFLEWLYYADAVFTNSFHGTSFALIFEKKLGADRELANGKTNKRVEEVVELFGDDNAFISSDKYVPSITTNNRVLKTVREDAIRFIKDICEDK